MKVKIEISCCLCSNNHEQEVDIPDGWGVRYNSIASEAGFCPDHSIISKFAESQCPCCVGGWQDCDLWGNFAYSKHNLTDQDFETLANGICPKRTNGTMVFNSATGEMSKLDLRDPEKVEAGKAFVKAIKEYWEMYPERQIANKRVDLTTKSRGKSPLTLDRIV